MYGNTVVITLFKLDLDDLKIKVGDFVDISQLKKQDKKWGLNMKCTNCNDLIPKGQEAFFKRKIVCQYCYNRLKVGKRNGEGATIQKAYMAWLQRKWHQEIN